MKRILLLAVVAVMLLTSVACTTNSSSTPATTTAQGAQTTVATTAAAQKKDPVKLEYWFEGAGPERTPTHERIISEFNAQSDYITVEGVYVDLASGLDKVNVAWAGKTMPDVIYVQAIWISSMTAQKMCLQLDDLFGAWDESKQFSDSSLAYMRSMDMSGGLYVVPTGTNITGIWYRTDVFAAKNAPAPTTWDNFFNACEIVTDKADGVYGHILRGGKGSCNQLINEIICYAGYDDYWSADGKAQILRSPEAAEYVNRFADLYKNGYAPESSMTAGFTEMVADFNAQVAMTLIHNLGSYENQRQTFTPDQYAFVPFPTAVNGKLTEMVATCKGVVISAITKHPEEAWEYVKWNTSEQAVSDINELIGELPTRIDSASHEWVKTAPHMAALPEYTAAPKQVVSNPNYLPDYSSINNDYAEPKFQEVLAGKLSASDFLNGWADLLEPAYAEYMAQKSK